MVADTPRTGEVAARLAGAGVLLRFEQVPIWVTVLADVFWHRIVRLDQKIAVPVPREGLDAVSGLDVGFGAEKFSQTHAISSP